jgi:hypothetical protein
MAPRSGRTGLPTCICGKAALRGEREPPTDSERAGTQARPAKEGGRRCHRSGRRRMRHKARQARRGGRSRRRRPRAGNSAAGFSLRPPLHHPRFFNERSGAHIADAFLLGSSPARHPELEEVAAGDARAQTATRSKRLPRWCITAASASDGGQPTKKGLPRRASVRSRPHHRSERPGLTMLPGRGSNETCVILKRGFAAPRFSGFSDVRLLTPTYVAGKGSTDLEASLDSRSRHRGRGGGGSRACPHADGGRVQQRAERDHRRTRLGRQSALVALTRPSSSARSAPATRLTAEASRARVTGRVDESETRVSPFGSSATTRTAALLCKTEFARAQGRCDVRSAWGVELKRESLGSVEELQLETPVMCSPGREVEVELAARLALGRSVGDDNLDRVIVDLVGNAAPAVEEVP